MAHAWQLRTVRIFGNAWLHGGCARLTKALEVLHSLWQILAEQAHNDALWRLRTNAYIKISIVCYSGLPEYAAISK